MHDETEGAIAGITLAMYAEVTARAVRMGLPAHDAAAVVLGEPITQADWMLAGAEWRARMEISEAVRAEYTAYYAQARAVR